MLRSLEDRELVELYIERPKRSVVGNVYLGKVTDVLPGMQAAFVDIGLEKNTFLYVDEVVAPEGLEGLPRRDIQSLLKPGQQVMVQVTKDPMGTKGARVTTEITLPGRFLVLMPFSEFVGVSKKVPDAERDRLHAIVSAHVPPKMGVIVRTAAQGASERDLVSDLEFLLGSGIASTISRPRRWRPRSSTPRWTWRCGWCVTCSRDDFRRLVIDDKSTFDKVVSFMKKTSPELLRNVQLFKDRTSLFETYELQPAIDSALRRTVALPSGGYLTIDKTEALTAVDVNTGQVRRQEEPRGDDPADQPRGRR